MNFTSYFKTFGLPIFFMAISVGWAGAQDSKTNTIGVSVLAEHEFIKGFSPSVGFVFERSLTKRSGIETGIFYKTYRSDFNAFVPIPEGGGYYEYIKVRESYLNFPVLYRFYTKSVTISLGPVVEAFVGWDQISSGNSEVTSYEIDPSVDFGPLLKVSKTFTLGDNLIAEPEFRFGIMAKAAISYFGFGVQLKQGLLQQK
ncbi:outer membrane beta-barrel protein [Algoriphagus sp. A40]|uniref:outer membrane beta-barrel protein n=1 Tax=Algoriphagus sp. A40 TaxID=1945863 RepID=UPI0009876AE7|nr:outer membrane beta-barrel protein [Algoriphagus sp. A40]OOG77712.1 hypothetical protein B0E43_03960 [Algoriphagus sp. A40]